MTQNLNFRKATFNDLEPIIALLLEDEFGQARELRKANLDQRYIDAYEKINADPHHYLMIVENEYECVGMCHLTLIPSLSFIGSTRLQIEEVRVSEKYRGQKVGTWMIETAIAYGADRGAKIVQLTTNKKRERAKIFYERLGFKASHEGLKLKVGDML
jgi:ribosomal protein S18 acetylase RimI-like enzyme